MPLFHIRNFITMDRSVNVNKSDRGTLEENLLNEHRVGANFQTVAVSKDLQQFGHRVKMNVIIECLAIWPRNPLTKVYG